MAARIVLHYGVAIPVRRVARHLLRALTGVESEPRQVRSPRTALRRAQGAVGDAYHRLSGCSVCESRVVHTDDTGKWRVGGEGAFF